MDLDELGEQGVVASAVSSGKANGNVISASFL